MVCITTCVVSNPYQLDRVVTRYIKKLSLDDKRCKQDLKSNVMDSLLCTSSLFLFLFFSVTKKKRGLQGGITVTRNKRG